jgi:hypothetical protein
LSNFQEITFLIRGSSAVNDIPVLFRMNGSPILLMTELPTFSKSARIDHCEAMLARSQTSSR